MKYICTSITISFQHQTRSKQHLFIKITSKEIGIIPIRKNTQNIRFC